MNVDFREKEIVWAKIKNNPWWPGIIQKISYLKNESENTSDKIYNNDLIGQDFHVKLAKKNIESFINNFQEHNQTNNQNLLNSIEIAQKLYERNNTENIIEIIENENEDTNINKENIQKMDSIKKSSRYSDTTTSQITNFEFETIEIENKSTIFLNKKRNEDSQLLFPIISNKTQDISKNMENNIKNNINKNLKNKNQNTVNINSSLEENKTENIINNEIINEIIKKLINYQIQISNNSTQKIIIIKELDELKSQLCKENNFNIFNLTKSLLPVLNSFTYNRNPEIISKANEILSYITERTIKEIFLISKEDKKLFDEIINFNEENLELEICELINQKNRNTKIEKIPENEISDNDECKNINEDFFFIIKNNDILKREKEFNELSGDFYKNIYNKKDNGLNYSNGNKRRFFCIKMLNLVKKLMPENSIDFLKKVIIFFEYQIRNEDPTFGKKYCNTIKNLCKKMKEIIEGKKIH